MYLLPFTCELGLRSHEVMSTIDLLCGNFSVQHRFQSLVMFPHQCRVWVYVIPVSFLLSCCSQCLLLPHGPSNRAGLLRRTQHPPHLSRSHPPRPTLAKCVFLLYTSGSWDNVILFSLAGSCWRAWGEHSLDVFLYSILWFYYSGEQNDLYLYITLILWKTGKNIVSLAYGNSSASSED